MRSSSNAKILYHKFAVADRFYVYDAATNSIMNEATLAPTE